MSQLDSILDSFRRAIRPPARLRPSEWASGRVVIQDGLTPRFDISLAPWLREPLDSLGDPEAKEIVLLAPIGTGKTTMVEAGMAFVISEDPGPTLLVGQTDDDLSDWAETRFAHMLQNTTETRDLFPSDRHKRRKMAWLFPHMSAFLTGANLSGLQSKSMRRVWCDEAWQYRPGRLREARGRLHDRWNRQFFVMSQAGVTGDDLDLAWADTDCREFSWTCPKCGHIQPWNLENIAFDRVAEDEQDWMIKSAMSARMKCLAAGCDWSCGDNAQERRKLSEESIYVGTKSGLPHHVGYHYTVFANWRKPLWEIVVELLKAEKAKANGDLEPLKQFHQKRLARPWDVVQLDSRQVLLGGGYSVSDYADGRLIDNEAARMMVCDVQSDHFWVGIRAWRSVGSSRLLWYGKLWSKEQVEELRIKYNVRNRLVFFDAQWERRRDEILTLCAENDYTALFGSPVQTFRHTLQNGKQIDRAYSLFRNEQTAGGKLARTAFFSNERCKDILYNLRTGQGALWEIPDDCPDTWLKQIDTEEKVEVVSKKTGQVQRLWQKQKRDNHAWDVEDMQVAAACMLRLIAAE